MIVRSRLPASRLRTAMGNARAENLPRIPRNLPVLAYYLSNVQFRQVTNTLDAQDNIYAGCCGVSAMGTVSVVFFSRRMLDLLQRQQQVY